MIASLHSLHVYTLNRTTQDRLLLTLVSLFNTSACLVYNNPSGAAFNMQRVLFHKCNIHQTKSEEDQTGKA